MFERTIYSKNATNVNELCILIQLQGETGVIGFHKICYRIVAQKPLGYFKKHFSWILDAKDGSKPTVNEIFTPGSYESLSTLVRHTQVRRWNI